MAKRNPGNIFLLLLLLLAGTLNAQVLTNRRSTNLAYGDTIRVDTLSIIPGSFTLYGGNVPIPADAYILLEAEAKIIPDLGKITRLQADLSKLRAEYRVFPINFSKPVQDEVKYSLVRKTTTDPKKDPFLIYDLNQHIQPVNDFKFEGLTKSGSLTRGVSFGSSQDASIVSSFNLQLSGKLNNDVEILAAITDENIPIQPDGNTQTLQDFDRIFIQLSKGSTKVIGGDFQITKPTGYFLNMYKRAQGLSFSTAFPNRIMFRKKELPGSMKVGVSGAVARGKFRRQEFNGVEGNQGPYRLTGNEGETFIVVLSGSESVYIDGRKLERGLENDYVIDYNTSEITFTANSIITKDKRIIVEFEYSDRNYQRWMVQTTNEWDYKNFRYYLNFFMELDDKNAPLNQTLSDTQKVILFQAGDSSTLAVAPSIDSVGFNTTEILYKKIDTVANSLPYTIFVYSTSPDSAFYRVRFSYIGSGQGDYVQVNTVANGKVYRWVAPNANGSHNGDYAPVVQLVTPKSQRMVTLGADYRFNRNFRIDGEGALSFLDRNTFSPLNDGDNVGYAFRVNGHYEARLRKKENDTLLFTTRISYEQVDRNFRPFIRFRSVEFERDWNFINRNNPNAAFQQTVQGTDYLPGITLELRQPSWGKFTFQSQAYIKGAAYTAYRNLVNLQLRKKRWDLQWNGSQTATTDSVNGTLFLRQKLHLQRSFNFLTFGIQGETEYNRMYERSTDSLFASSYMFNDWEFFIANGDSLRHKLRLFYKVRIDHLAGDNRLEMAAIAHHVGASFELIRVKDQLLKTTITYRYLQITDTTLLKKSNENSILARVEYNGRFLQNAISLDLFYEVGSGLENRRDYQFIQSLNGLGTHVWLDYNGNGIRERDEYEIRTGTVVGTDGLTYIKFFVPTATYVRTYYNAMSASLNLKAPDSWKRKKGARKFFSRFISQTVFRVDQKTQKDDLAASFNPFGFGTQDTALLSMNYSLRQTLYFNRFSSRLGLEANYQDVRNKTLLTNGIDTRTNRYGSLRGRWNITRMFSLNLEARYGVKTSSSQFLRNRDYRITYWEVAPDLVCQPNSKFRITLSYQYTRKDNSGVPGDTVNLGGQTASIHTAGLEFKTNFILKGQLQIKGGYIHIDYNDVMNTALAFEMLNGLNTGHNVTWGASFQRTLGNNLQLTLTYDGRKSEGANFIHIGSVQLRAFF